MFDKIKATISGLFKKKSDDYYSECLHDLIIEAAHKLPCDVSDDILKYTPKTKNETILQLICKNGKFFKRYVQGDFCFYCFKYKDKCYTVAKKYDSNIWLQLGKCDIEKNPLINGAEPIDFTEEGTTQEISLDCIMTFVAWIDKAYPVKDFPYTNYKEEIVDDWFTSSYDKEIAFLTNE